VELTPSSGTAVASEGSGRGDRLIVGALVIAMPGGGDLGDMLLCPFDETVEEAGGLATQIGELVVNAWGMVGYSVRSRALALERP
jgi:hypothetical protein